MWHKSWSFRPGFILQMAMVSLLVTLPLWHFPYFPDVYLQSIDYLFNLITLNQFSHQLWSGEFYPRWLLHANDGFGSPVFTVYPPFSFYIGSLFAWLAPIDPYAIGRLILSLDASLVVSGVTMYMWLRRLYPEKTAQYGGWLYAFFPYKFTYIYLMNGSFSTLWAMAFSPLLLLFTDHIIEKKNGAIGMAALCWGLMLMTHIITAVCFLPVPFFYIFLMSPSDQRIRGLWHITVAGCLGTGLAAIYLLPLAYNNHYVDSEKLVSGFHDYKWYLNHFLTFNLTALFYILLPVIAMIMEHRKDNGMIYGQTFWTRFNICWVILLSGTFFFVTPLSGPIWELITPLRNLQFPFRVYSSSMFIATCLIVPFLAHQGKRKTAIFLVLFSALFCFLAGLYYHLIHLKNSGTSLQNSEHILKIQHIIFPEYRTKWQTAPYEPPPVTEGTYFLTGNGTVNGFKESARHLHLEVTITSPSADITFHRYYFPSWEMTPKPAEATIFPSADHGLLSVHLLQGHYDITLNQSIVGEREGAWISLLALMMIGGLVSRRKPS